MSNPTAATMEDPKSPQHLESIKEELSKSREEEAKRARLKPVAQADIPV